MAEEPEKVLPQERRAALVPGNHLVRDHEAAGNEEAGSREAIEKEQDASGEKNSEGQQTKNRGDKPGPAGQRKAPERHALGAKINQRGDEIQRAHQRRAAEYCQPYNPKCFSSALPGTYNFSERTQRRVRGPATDRSAAGH